jgi:prevent-host-death family protein
MVITMTSRQFNQEVAAAKRSVAKGEHVIVTDRGNPSAVMVPFSDYIKTAFWQPQSIVEKLGSRSGVERIEFEPFLEAARAGIDHPQAAIF